MFLGVLSFLVLGCANICLLFYRISRKKKALAEQVAQKAFILKGTLNDKKKLELEVSELNQTLAKTLNMYEAARDICVSLEEEELLTSFKTNLKNFIHFSSCLIFGPADFDQKLYQRDLVFPLLVKEECLGYLIVQGAAAVDNEYAGILINHLALGIKRARLYKNIQELAITDGLTGLYTRRYALGRLEEEYRRSEAYGLNLSFLMIDVDNFKECNDRFGHLVGDNVLIELAACIRENIREVDMPARFGGEEFMVVAPNTSQESAFAIAQRIRQSISAVPIRAYDEKVPVTVSIGVASFPSGAKKPDLLIAAADKALYTAKRAGRDRVVCYE
jgi:diguanylate cyclase (GGDEF)-like protein